MHLTIPDIIYKSEISTAEMCDLKEKETKGEKLLYRIKNFLSAFFSSLGKFFL